MIKKLFGIFILVFFNSALIFAQEEMTPLMDGLPIRIAPTPANVEMVLVPAGSFLMGSTEAHVLQLQISYKQRPLNSQWFNDEIPQHSYYLTAYYIDRYEVTNKQYRQFMKETKRQPPAFWNDPTLNADNQPVVGVNWADADAFCWWAKKRLPLEAEWEKAARGTNGRIYPWGEKWYNDYANSVDSGLGTSVAVGSYPKGVSPCGAMDMAGNVWEWCSDWYDEYIYRFSAEHRPQYNRLGYRVIRGGSFLDNSFELRTTYRYRFKQKYNFTSLGFRCVKNP